MNKRNYWEVTLYGASHKTLFGHSLYKVAFDDKPTAERFALEAVEVGPFSSSTVETFELVEDFGPKVQFSTFDEFLDAHERERNDWKEQSD